MKSRESMARGKSRPVASSDDDSRYYDSRFDVFYTFIYRTLWATTPPLRMTSKRSALSRVELLDLLPREILCMYTIRITVRTGFFLSHSQVGNSSSAHGCESSFTALRADRSKLKLYDFVPSYS